MPLIPAFPEHADPADIDASSRARPERHGLPSLLSCESSSSPPTRYSKLTAAGRNLSLDHHGYSKQGFVAYPTEPTCARH